MEEGAVTCIVGLVADDAVWLGGDSAAVSGWDLMSRADHKVFIRADGPGKPWGFGFTTSFRMGQLIRWKLELPDDRLVESPGLERFMASEFVDALRKALKDGGWGKKNDEREEAGQFLVGHRGHLFLVDSDYQVGEGIAPFAAVGAGSAYALGSLHSSHLLPAEQRVLEALAAAERFNAAVRRPFHTLRVGP